MASGSAVWRESLVLLLSLDKSCLSLAQHYCLYLRTAVHVLQCANTDLFVFRGHAAAFPAAVRSGRARRERGETTAGAAASAASSAGGDGRPEETTAVEVRRGGRHRRRPKSGRRECAPSSCGGSTLEPHQRS